MLASDELSEPAPGSESASDAMGLPDLLYWSTTSDTCSGVPNSATSAVASMAVMNGVMQPVRWYSVSVMRPSVSLSHGMPPHSSGRPMKANPASRYASPISSGMPWFSYMAFTVSSSKYLSANSWMLSISSS